ncbi:cadherin-like domain-containing protein [Microcoleus sp. F6_C1]
MEPDAMLLEEGQGSLFPVQDETQKPVGDLSDDSSTISDEDLAQLIQIALAENTDGLTTTFPALSNGVVEEGAGDDDDNGIAFETVGGTDDDDDGLEDDSGIDRRRTVVGTDDDDLIVATDEQDEIYGKKGKDKIKGNRRKKNKIYGGKDDDDCEGGDDDDEIKGDSGNDTVMGGQGKDTLNGGKENDTVMGGSDDDICKGDDGDDWAHGNEGNDDVGGGAGNDTVYGGKGDDDCEGGDGNDTVRGDTGNDTVMGGGGNDTVNGGKDNDTVSGGVGSDVCSGDDGDDSVSGGADDDTVMGGGGSDVCSGDDGDDSVSGGADDDTVMGGGGSDVCMGDDGDDSVMGGDGDDTVMGGGGNDTLVTGGGNDMADGGDGDDSVSGGGDGDDTLMGGGGNDTLMGGTGNHTCVGGAGDDVYVISNSTSGASAVITDYEDDSDKFLLFGDLNFSSLTFVQVGGNTEIRVNNFALALLLNVNATLIAAGDFLGVNPQTPTPTPTQTPTPTPTQNPISNPPRAEANNGLITGSSGGEQTITSELLRFVDDEQGPSNTVFKLTELPDATTGQLFFKGVAVTQVGFTFTQADINAGSLSFKAAVGFIGALSFGFEVSNGKRSATGQRFSLNVEQNVFKFGGTTAPQVIVGSATLDNDIEGSDGDDDITAGKGKDKIIGGKGKDKIKGGDGDDDIDGGDDDDDIEVSLGKNKIKGGKGKDKIKGGDDDDDIDGGDDDDDIVGGKGKNKIKGGSGKDKIQGGDDDDDIDGGDDDDDIVGGKGKNTLKGGLGKDKIQGDDDDDDIDGGDDDDDIIGGKGKNKLKGGLGNDKVQGGDDDDEIEGGLGTNTLIGGAGKDRFIYRTSRQEIQTVVEADFITDFNVDDDLLELSTAAFGNLSVSSLTRLEITATSTVGSIGSANLLDFTADITVNSIASLQARFTALGGSLDAPTFCQFTDAATGRSVLVFGFGARFEIVTSFSVDIRLQVSNFVFTGTSLNVPVGTSGPDNVNFGTYPAAVNFNGLAGNDNIVGSNFNDTLNGGDGNDTITGGLGLDVLTGGSGADLFVYRTTKEGGDKISDFKSGTDKFQFTASAFGNLTTTNFDAVSGSTPDITGKELVIFTGGTYASLEAAQVKALGNSTSAGFFAFTNASNETVLYFDSNGTVAGGSTLIANLGTAASNLGTADFVFTGTIASSPTGTTTDSGSVVDLTAAGNTYPSDFNNFGSGAGGYNFTTPVLFTGDAKANSVTGTEFADILSGGSGADILTGGAGADIFVYKAAGEGGDKISDFKSGTDKFQFTASAFGNLTTTNFDAVSGSTPDITGKELVIFTGGSYASLEAAQAKVLGNSTTAGFFAFTNASNETVLYFDSNGTVTGGSTLIANLGTAASNLGTADFVFTGTIASGDTGTSPTGTTTDSGSVVDLTAAGNTYPTDFNNFGSGAGGYNFTTPVLFTGDAKANSVTGTEFADIFSGGSGADILTGGAGADLFVYKATGEGGDTITDFTSGSDKFEFSASAFGNLTTTNFDAVSGSTPEITGKEFVIFTGGSYASLEEAQATALGNSTTAGFFAFTNASNETVLYFDSNGTAAGGSSLIANLGTPASNLGTADFVFTGTIASGDTGTSPTGTTTNSGSVADLTAAGNTFPVAFNNFGSGAGGYNFTTPVLFTGDAADNNVTGTEFADIFSGGLGVDRFNGGAGNDSISGGAGNDSLFGGGGSDTLNGDEGNDTLIGGLGTNVLNGGAGADQFTFLQTTAGGGDLITDYSIADDQISISNAGFQIGTGAAFVTQSFYAYSSTVSDVTVFEANLTQPSFIALYDGLSTKLYYDSNGSTVGGNSLFATVNVDLGVSGNTELFLF